MKKQNLVILLITLFPLYFSSCNSGSSVNNSQISNDPATIAKGETIFNQYCVGCHNFRQDGIGPNLSGITTLVTSDWIQHFIKDPKKMIDSKDKRAQELFKKYKVAMPAFATFKDDEIQDIVTFLNTHQKIEHPFVKGNGNELSNPISDTIQLSDLLVNLSLITQIPASSDSGKLPFTRITKLDFEKKSGSTFILDLRGKLYKLQNNKPVVYMNMAELKPKFIAEPSLGTGFGSFAFHPDFAKNGLLYTTHTESTGSGKADFSYADSIKVELQCVVTEWKTTTPGAATFSGTSRELFRVNMVTSKHAIQDVAFNPLAKTGNYDYGLLYICIGDGACVEEGYPFLAHSKDKVWGSILRINPAGNNSANKKYGIPEKNPFAKNNNPKVLGEIYAYGLRNPHRISWTKSGNILVCNIGQANIESVNLILPGSDYGWPIREGTFSLNPYGDLNKVYSLPANDSIYKITYPIAEYDHGEGIAISGGYEYWGTTVPELRGKYLFGDIPSGRLFYINMADIKLGKQAPIKEWKISINNIPTRLLKVCGSVRVDLHFGRDAKGELYILTKADGKVYQLASATTKSKLLYGKKL